MRELTVREAIREALWEEMTRDPSVFIYGEDIADYGGVFGVTDGLKDEFGPERVFDTPLAETSLGGTAVGAALAGARPVVEIMFADFTPILADHLINYAAKMYFNYGDETSVPVVFRTAYGGGGGSYGEGSSGGSYGMHHSQTALSWFQNVPGLTIVMPSTPHDYKGLLKAAIRSDDPILFMEHKTRYDDTGPVPSDDYVVPLCRSEIKRAGSDVTIVAVGGMVDQAISAAERLAEEGIECEIVDPRTIVPLDIDPIVESVEKTTRAMTVHETPVFGGIGGEIASQISTAAFDTLEQPVRRVGAPFTPVPFSPELQRHYLPDASDIVTAARALV